MAAAAEADTLKWEGKAATTLPLPTAEQVWPLLADFCGIHKWLPTLDTSYKVDGVDGQPGLVRYCASGPPPPPDGGDLQWCQEKLVEIDPINKWLSYEILDNNLGFKSYRATLKVAPIDGGDDPIGCQIEWSFVGDPIEGLGFADFCAYLDLNLQGMAKNIEKALELSGN
ncbi:hypothetical protein ACS0TY_012313 [Phlomoides rotata]